MCVSICVYLCMHLCVYACTFDIYAHISLESATQLVAEVAQYVYSIESLRALRRAWDHGAGVV